MATNKFLGWTLADLLAARLEIQRARLVGVTTVVMLAGVRTEVDPSRVDLDKLLEELQYAISLLDTEEENPANERPGITRPNFL